MVDAMNASFYFGVVKEVRRQQAGKQQELQRQHAQHAAALQRPSAARWEQDEGLEPPSPLAQHTQQPGYGLPLPRDAQREQWQHQHEARGQLASPFQARWRQPGEELQRWPEEGEEDEGGMHQAVPPPMVLRSQQAALHDWQAPRAQQLPRRHSVDVRRSMEHQPGLLAGASLRRSVDYQRQVALWQQQSARGAGQLVRRASLDLPALGQLAPRASLDPLAQKQLAGSLQEWGGPSPRTVVSGGAAKPHPTYIHALGRAAGVVAAALVRPGLPAAVAGCI